jgi:hypothetical protein
MATTDSEQPKTRNAGIDWDLLAFADAVAAAERERHAALEKGRIPDRHYQDDDCEIAVATAALQRRRAESEQACDKSITPLVKVAQEAPQRAQERAKVDLQRYLSRLTEGCQGWFARLKNDRERWHHLKAWQTVADRRADDRARLTDEQFRRKYGTTKEQHLAEDNLAGLADLPPIPESAIIPDIYGLNEADYSLGLGIYVGVQAGLNRAGVSNGTTYLYWILQHRARRGGSDQFTADELLAYIIGLDLGIEWTLRRVRDLLRKGLNMLWEYSHRDRQDKRQYVYRMVSKRRVMGGWGITDSGKRAQLPDHAFASLEAFKAYAWDAFRELHPGNGVQAQETIARDFGISRSTAYDYEAMTRPTITNQYASAAFSNAAQEQEILERAPGYHWYTLHHWYHQGERFSQPYINWQEPSRTESTSTDSTSNRRKYLNREVAAIADNASRNSVEQNANNLSSSEAQPIKVTRHFDRDQEAYRFRRDHPTEPSQTFRAHTPQYTHSQYYRKKRDPERPCYRHDVSFSVA